MDLILLRLGDSEPDRFPNLKAAQENGALLHSAQKPARIEAIPKGGLNTLSLVYDAESAAWVPFDETTR